MKLPIITNDNFETAISIAQLLFWRPFQLENFRKCFKTYYQMLQIMIKVIVVNHITFSVITLSVFNYRVDKYLLTVIKIIIQIILSVLERQIDILAS